MNRVIAPKNRMTGAQATVVQKMNKAAWQEQLVPIMPGGCIRSCLDFGACPDEYRELLFLSRKKVTAETHRNKNV